MFPREMLILPLVKISMGVLEEVFLKFSSERVVEDEVKDSLRTPVLSVAELEVLTAVGGSSLAQVGGIAT